VCVIAQAEAMVDGFPSELHLVGHIGNQANKIPMLAQGLGRARGEFDAAMGQLRRPYF
jgi:hypothetical protein